MFGDVLHPLSSLHILSSPNTRTQARFSPLSHVRSLSSVGEGGGGGTRARFPNSGWKSSPTQHVIVFFLLLNSASSMQIPKASDQIAEVIKQVLQNEITVAQTWMKMFSTISAR